MTYSDYDLLAIYDYAILFNRHTMTIDHITMVFPWHWHTMTMLFWGFPYNISIYRWGENPMEINHPFSHPVVGATPIWLREASTTFSHLAMVADVLRTSALIPGIIKFIVSDNINLCHIGNKHTENDSHYFLYPLKLVSIMHKYAIWSLTVSHVCPCFHVTATRITKGLQHQIFLSSDLSVA